MEIKLKLELKNVFGGDGIIRVKKIEKPILKRTKKRTITKKDIGIPVDTATEELKTEIKHQEVHTFQIENSKPILRLGGVHGKLWGAMKQAGQLLAQLGDSEFKYKLDAERYMAMVNIDPIYVELENTTKMEEVSLPQLLATYGNKMVIQYFDMIPKCNCRITISFPDSIKTKVFKMLKQVERMAVLNKRRAKIKISNWDKI